MTITDITTTDQHPDTADQGPDSTGQGPDAAHQGPDTTSIVMLDPTVLAAHPTNVRQSLRDLRGMARSIKAIGILVPLVVVPADDGGHQIVAGHRRCAAAAEAGLTAVPCLVRPDLDDARQVAAMLVENTQREALSGAEEAAGYEQLAVLGLSDSGIAKATGATRRHVAKARQVAASEVATAVAGRYDLSLDQALVIAEFDDDHDAVKELAVVATKDPGRFEHQASRLRQDRTRAAQRDATAQALAAAGVTVLTEAERYNDHPGSASLLDLVAADGTALTPESHADCPGHCAVVKDWEPTTAAYFCLAPAKHGHRSRYGSGRPRTKMTDQDKAERRQVVENNKAWKAADPVRRTYVQRLLVSRKVPAGTLRYAVGEVLLEPDRVGDGSDELLAELLGVATSAGYGRHVGAGHLAKLTDARLSLGLLAQVAAGVEHSMGVHTWRSPQPRAARWLAFLASAGYGMSDIERHVIDQVHNDADQGDPDSTWTDADGEPPADPAGDAGDSDGEVIALHAETSTCDDTSGPEPDVPAPEPAAS